MPARCALAGHMPATSRMLAAKGEREQELMLTVARRCLGVTAMKGCRTLLGRQ